MDHWPRNPGGSQTAGDNFRTQTPERAARGELLLGLLLTNREKLAVNVVTGQLELQQLRHGCTEHLKEGLKGEQQSRARTLRFRTDFSFLRSRQREGGAGFQRKIFEISGTTHQPYRLGRLDIFAEGLLDKVASFLMNYNAKSTCKKEKQ